MVTMWEAFVLFWKRYVDFSGRSTRAEYWWMMLWNFLIGLVFIILLLILGAGVIAQVVSAGASGSAAGDVSALAGSSVGLIIVIILGVLLALAMFIPMIALTIRRYRDAGLATWAAWVLWVLTFFFGSYTASSDGSVVQWLVSLFGIVAFIVTLLATDTLAHIGGIGNGGAEPEQLEYVSPVDENKHDEF